MSEPESPRAVVETLLRAVTSGEWDLLPTLYASDAVVDLPFAEPPVHLAGRDEIREHFERARQAPLALNLGNVVVHETLDPEVVVAEFDYDVRVTTTGRAFTTANVQVVRVRAGKIVESRDYHDHGAIARAFGRTS